MLCLCTIILRNGMRELPKFGMLFGLLCGVNFVFYAMPVLGYIISGKSEQRVRPIDSMDYGAGYHQTHQLTYTLTVKTMPLFDVHKGLAYNAMSLGELLMPIAMLMGTYLGVSAHYEYQAHVADLLPDSSDDELGRADAALFAAHRAGEHTRGDLHAAGVPGPARSAPVYGAIFGAATGGVPPSSEQSKKAHKAFSGTSHKLDA
jgi:hypothetical protein